MIKNPLLSIIIPAYNEEKDILFAIKSLKSQSYSNFEIILVDDGSTDNTIKVAQREKVKILKQNHKGPGAARNLGAEKAKGEILIFVDSDMTFEKDYLKNLIKPITSNNKVIGTTHDYEIVKNTSNIWSRCWGKVRVSKETAKDVKIFRAIRKKSFMNLGKFNPKYGYADDQTFWFEKKIKPIVAENTTCYHRNPETLKGVYKQSAWIGASIDNPVFTIPLVKYLVPILLFIISPLMIPLLAIKKTIRLREFSIFHYIFIFMFARYFGAIKGIARKIYFNRNFR